MKTVFTFLLLFVLLFSDQVSYGQGQAYLSTDNYTSTYTLDARARNGGTSYEAVLISPANTAGVNLNPTGSPAWVYGQAHQFEFTYTYTTGTTTWKIDFNRDGDFADSQESCSTVSPTLVDMGFKYVNIFIQGQNATIYLALNNLTINGTNFGTYTSPNNQTGLSMLFANYNGMFSDISVTGTIMMTAGYGTERPRFWIRTGKLMNVYETWLGSVNSDWNNPANWAGNNVPTANEDVLIPVGAPMPILSEGQNYECGNLIVAASGLKSGSTTGGLLVSGGLNVYGDLSIPVTGTVVVPANGELTVNLDLEVDGNLIVEPKGSLITYGDIQGDATFQVSIPNDMSWHLLSSPVTGQSICNGQFAPTFPGSFPGDINTWDFYNWLPSCPTPPDPPERWRNLRTGSGTPNTVDFPGLTFWQTRGYLVAYGDGWPEVKSFVGPPPCCSQVCTFYDVIDECSWSLPGNPFPSSVDWSLFEGKENLQTDYYYIWNESKSGGPGYEYWKDASHYSSNMVNGYIAPMQGFFVKVDPYGELAITIPNEARSHNSATWLKSNEPPQNRLTIKLGNGTNFDEAFVMFDNNSLVGKDRSDAEKLFSLEKTLPQVYTIVSNDQKTGLNCLPYITNGATIPLGFIAPANDDYAISVLGIESFTSLEGLTLEDKELHYSQNLLQNPVYTFSSSKTENADRFVLHFAGPIGVNEKGSKAINIYSNEKTVFITSQAGLNNAHVTVSNLLGQEILSQKLKDQPVNQLKLDVLKGYYIVKVQDNTSVRTTKVFIN